MSRTDMYQVPEGIRRQFIDYFLTKPKYAPRALTLRPAIEQLVETYRGSDEALLNGVLRPAAELGRLDDVVQRLTQGATPSQNIKHPDKVIYPSREKRVRLLAELEREFASAALRRGR